MLVIHNSLYMKGMEVNLIYPFMIRLTGHGVDEYPKFVSEYPTINSYAIKIADPELIIHLYLKGVTIFVPTRKPTVEESKSCIYIDLIPNNSDWNPHDMDYADQESCMLIYRGDLVFPILCRSSIVDS